MGELRQPRDLLPHERDLLEFMLSIDFPNREELLRQLPSITVWRECDCGCGTIDLTVRDVPVSNVVEKIAIEAYGNGVDVLLFTRNNQLPSPEIVDHGDNRPLPYPKPSQLNLRLKSAKGQNIAPQKS